MILAANHVRSLDRFISRDPIEYLDGVNLYQYVWGSPINGLDPTGQNKWLPPVLLVICAKRCKDRATDEFLENLNGCITASGCDNKALGQCTDSAVNLLEKELMVCAIFGQGKAGDCLYKKKPPPPPPPPPCCN